MTNTSAKFDIYEFINNEIIAQLENGIIPWLKPWTGRADGAYSRATGKPYSLLNQFLLGGSGEWATFKQITEAGGKIKKGEKARQVVYWSQVKITEKDENGKPLTDNSGKPIEKLCPCSNITAFSVSVLRPKASNLWKKRLLRPSSLNQKTMPPTISRHIAKITTSSLNIFFKIVHIIPLHPIAFLYRCVNSSPTAPNTSARFTMKPFTAQDTKAALIDFPLLLILAMRNTAVKNWSPKSERLPLFVSSVLIQPQALKTLPLIFSHCFEL